MARALRIVGICLVVLAAVTVPLGTAVTVASATDHSETDGIQVDVVYAGEGKFQTGPNQTGLWQSDPYTVQVKVRNVSADRIEVCLDHRQQTKCREVGLHYGGTTVGFDYRAWPNGTSGEKVANATVRTSDGTQRVTAGETIRVYERGADADGDGLSNEREFFLGTNPAASDTDRDGLGDRSEVETYSTDPTRADTDEDGLIDSFELQVGTDPLVADSDGDGLPDGEEVNTYDTDPTAVDTDEDGLPDNEEVAVGSDPTVSDTDGDGLADGREVEAGTDPTVSDTDGDGLADGREIEVGADPTVSDTDGDGLVDGREIEVGADPTDPDTDGDGLADGREIEVGADPTDPDTDGDLLNDATEQQLPLMNPRTPLLPGGLVLLSLLIVGSVVGYRHTDGAERLSEVLPDDIQSPDGPETEAVSEQADSGPISNAAHSDQSSEAMTNEQEVEQLLRANNGKMKQRDIVEQTDWSKATVSRVLSRMTEEDAVIKMPVGRENIIYLKGHEPVTDSPHE